jgi:galactose mutarotase-like enzyme
MPQLVEIKSKNNTALISTLGAELKSVKDHKGTEFMWQADADIWPRNAPILFPIVGKVRNDMVRVKGVTYGISQHGFARDRIFSVTSQTDSSVKMQLIYDDDTLKKYPFDFKLTLGYAWENDELMCSFEIENAGATDMPYSIGAHPGFNIPEGHFKNYSVKFEKEETAERYLLDNGLFNGIAEPLLQHSDMLPLSAELFDKDAIVFKNLQSSWVELKHNTGSYSIRMNFAGFPHFAIWAKKGTQRFVCLEPWFGYADTVEGHDDLSTKPGIRTLKPHEKFVCEYGLRFNN